MRSSSGHERPWPEQDTAAIVRGATDEQAEPVLRGEEWTVVRGGGGNRVTCGSSIAGLVVVSGASRTDREIVSQSKAAA